MVDRVRALCAWSSDCSSSSGVLPFLLLVALIVFTAISDHFLSAQNLINVVRQSVYLIIVSLGQMLALLTGGFDLSVGTIVALTSVVGATAMAAVVGSLARQRVAGDYGWAAWPASRPARWWV